MTNPNIHSKLHTQCRWGNHDKVLMILSESQEKVDLTFDDGVLFMHAVKFNTPKMLNVLLEYYEETWLKGDPNTLDYKVARHKLLDTLSAAEDSTFPSDEVKEVLDKYLPKEDGSDIDKLEEIELAFDDNDSTSSHSKGEESEGSTLSHDSAASGNAEKYEVPTEDSLRRLALIDQEDSSEGVHLSGENGELFVDNY